jgi:hypothetical protein
MSSLELKTKDEFEFTIDSAELDTVKIKVVVTVITTFDIYFNTPILNIVISSVLFLTSNHCLLILERTLK